MSPAITRPSKQFDTVIVGNGPSALILSFILHGNVPRYVGQHPDDNLHDAVIRSANILDFDSSICNLVRSSLKYSSQAHAVNVLLDTLLRPYGDVSDFSNSCIEWMYRPEKAISHIVLGESSRPGGQWADDPIIASKDIGTLSYAEQLSLPGYSFEDHWRRTRGEGLPELIRPSRADVSEYFAQYPEVVGIADSVKALEPIDGVSRTENGFHVASHNVTCKHLVLASGTFSINPPRPRSLRPLDSAHDRNGPVLVIGSGFTAADIIISTPPNREILHVYNWDPQNRPSPLKGCHSSAYPEYAWIYRQMKLAAAAQRRSWRSRHVEMKDAKAKEVSSLPFFSHRNWAATYTGFPNGKAAAIEAFSDMNHKEISIRRLVKVSITSPTLLAPIVRDVGMLQYAAGRRGSLDYLTPTLLNEVLHDSSQPTKQHNGSSQHFMSSSTSRGRDPDPWTGENETRPPSPSSALHSPNSSINTPGSSSRTPGSTANAAPSATISGQAFRDRIDETGSMEIAPNVFAIGSLTGDSLVRFAPGGCCLVAGAIMKANTMHDDSAAPIKAEVTNGDLKAGGKENTQLREDLVHLTKPGRAAAADHVAADGAATGAHSHEQYTAAA